MIVSPRPKQRTSGRTVVVLTKVTVEPPLTDGAVARFHELGVFSTIAAVNKTPRWLWEPEPGLHYYSLDEFRLDDPGSTCRTLILDGKTRRPRGGFFSPLGAEPWNGRPGCTYKPGQIVCFVAAERYRIGVVLAPPPPREDARRLSLDQSDNVLLVGLLGPRWSPAGTHHDHVPPALLFPVRHRLPKAFREALRAHYERYVEANMHAQRTREASKTASARRAK